MNLHSVPPLINADTCSACGLQLRPGAKFCAQCGSTAYPPPEVPLRSGTPGVAHEGETAPPQQREAGISRSGVSAQSPLASHRELIERADSCPECGKDRRPVDRFCRGCGHAYVAAAALPAYSAESGGAAPVAEPDAPPAMEGALFAPEAVLEGRAPSIPVATLGALMVALTCIGAGVGYWLAVKSQYVAEVRLEEQPAARQSPTPAPVERVAEREPETIAVAEASTERAQPAPERSDQVASMASLEPADTSASRVTPAPRADRDRPTLPAVQSAPLPSAPRVDRDRPAPPTVQSAPRADRDRVALPSLQSAPPPSAPPPPAARADRDRVALSSPQSAPLQSAPLQPAAPPTAPRASAPPASIGATAGTTGEGSASSIPRIQEEPGVMLARRSEEASRREPDDTAAPSQGEASPRAARTLDELFTQRAAAECGIGLVGFVCREKIRFGLCTGRWTDREARGRTACRLARAGLAPDQ